MEFRGPARLSSVVLLKRNLLDPTLYCLIGPTYLLCLAVWRHLSPTSFFLIFASLVWLLNRHLESYRSFRITGIWVSKLEREPKLTSVFLQTNFGDDYKSHGLTITERRREHDSFVWINKTIRYFWPYLSHLVHHELNQFLAHSSRLARSKLSMKRFLYALVRQVDANILAVEHCEIGDKAPFVKSLMVFDEGSRNKSLVYDLDFAYEGNMNVSFVCRYCCCCNSRIGLKDVFVHLRSRLAIGPIDDTKPRIEALSFSFLELPTFGYKGIALVELTELKLAKRSINRLIKEHLLHPKKLRVELEDLQRKLEERARQVQNEAINDEVVRSVSSDDPAAAPRRVPLISRILARMALMTCMCSNQCLRCCCQAERLQPNESD